VALARAPWNYDARIAISQGEAAAAADALATAAPNARSLFDTADRSTAELVSYNPHALNAYYVRARFLGTAGSYLGTATIESAVAVADAGIAHSPNDLVLRTSKAAALNALGRPAEAAQILAGYWDTDSHSPRPGLMYVAALVADGRSQEASAVLTDLKIRFPRNAEVAKFDELLSR
jgi:predicted Zn-dependent protease